MEYSVWNFSPYHNNPKNWDSQAWTNSVDPDQTSNSMVSDLNLHCLLLIKQLLDTLKGCEKNLLKLSGQVW